MGEIAFLTARAAAADAPRRGPGRPAQRAGRRSLGAGREARGRGTASELTGLTAAEIVAAVSDGGRGDLLRAHDLAARGRFREALPLAARFVAKNPDDFGGWFLKARCHDVLGQYEDARPPYSTCAALRPDRPGRSRPAANWRSATARTWTRHGRLRPGPQARRQPGRSPA